MEVFAARVPPRHLYIGIGSPLENLLIRHNAAITFHFPHMGSSSDPAGLSGDVEGVGLERSVSVCHTDLVRIRASYKKIRLTEKINISKLRPLDFSYKADLIWFGDDSAHGDRSHARILVGAIVMCDVDLYRSAEEEVLKEKDDLAS